MFLDKIISSRCQFFSTLPTDSMQPQWKSQQLILWISQTGSKVYIKMFKTQNHQHDTEGEEQSWRTDNTQSQDLL